MVMIAKGVHNILMNQWSPLKDPFLSKIINQKHIHDKNSRPVAADKIIWEKANRWCDFQLF